MHCVVRNIRSVAIALHAGRLLQCSCHLGLLIRAMEVDHHEVDNLETQFATMSLSAADSTSSTGGVDRSVILRHNPPTHSNPILMPIQIWVHETTGNGPYFEELLRWQNALHFLMMTACLSTAIFSAVKQHIWKISHSKNF